MHGTSLIKSPPTLVKSCMVLKKLSWLNICSLVPKFVTKSNLFDSLLIHQNLNP